LREVITNSAEETENLGVELAAELRAGDVIAMRGGLGAGKTAFIRGIAKGLGFTGETSSPTFALVHEYRGGRLDLFHFDMYRVGGYGDFLTTGFFDYLDCSVEDGGVCAVEWSENIEEYLDVPPQALITVKIDCISDDCRSIGIRKGSI